MFDHCGRGSIAKHRLCFRFLTLVVVTSVMLSSQLHGADKLTTSQRKAAEAAILRLRNSNPVQHIYTKGVPHTDRHGRQLDAYDAEKSFLPIGICHVVPTSEHDGKPLQEAGFNTMWPWAGYSVEDGLAYAEKYNLQAILQRKLPLTALSKFKDHPNLLAICWMDEPTGKPEMEKLFGEFQAYKQKAAEVAPGVPVFVNDTPGIEPPTTLWWEKWNTTGDISQHDNYPIQVGTKHGPSRTIAHIAETVSLATALNHERKPVWFVVGAFAWDFPPDAPFPFRYPTPEQLRAQVYAAVIHGATGIQYFCLDTVVGRDGLCLGVSPDPKVSFKTTPGRPMPPMSPLQMVKSKALWETITQVNQELRSLTPAILSPTVAKETLSYQVEVHGLTTSKLAETRPTPSDSPIRTLLKQQPGGEYVLLTVNLDNLPFKVTYRFKNPLQAARVLFENRTDVEKLVDGDKSVTLWYEPFDVHVLQITPALVSNTSAPTTTPP